MDSASSAAMAKTIANYLAGKIKKSKALDSFFEEFTEASINWIRPIFLKEDVTPKEVLQNLMDEPEDDLNLSDVSNAIQRKLRKNPDSRQLVQDIYNVIKAKEGEQKSINISGGNNALGNINATKSNIIIGNNNEIKHGEEG